MKQWLPLFRAKKTIWHQKRYQSRRSGIVVGVYEPCEGEYTLSPTATRIDEAANGKITDLLTKTKVRKGQVYVMSNVPGVEYRSVAVTNAGKEDAGVNVCQSLHEGKENIRVATSVAINSLLNMNMDEIVVDGFTHTEAAAEGAILTTYRYQDLLHKAKRKRLPCIQPHERADRASWDRGVVKANAQNVARELEDTPPNLLTPLEFSQRILDVLCPCGVTVEVHEQDWLRLKRMNSFLAMSKGSCEPPVLVELCYSGGDVDDRPVVMVGKGVTFDSGGLCLRKCEGMMDYKTDMAGAAVIVGVMKAVAQLALPINIFALLPMCENMPGLQAVKPGDIWLGLNGKTIKVKDTSREGRVVLADSLSYTSTFKPCLVITVATLTKAIKAVLGSSSSGVFTNSDSVWQTLEKAGADTGDRVWRMPLWDYFKPRVTDIMDADVVNVGKGSGGDGCNGAAFLMEFAPRKTDFAHVDITGTGMISSGLGYPYLKKGAATGRPVRTLLEFLFHLACPLRAG